MGGLIAVSDFFQKTFGWKFDPMFLFFALTCHITAFLRVITDSPVNLKTNIVPKFRVAASREHHRANKVGLSLEDINGTLRNGFYYNKITRERSRKLTNFSLSTESLLLRIVRVSVPTYRVRGQPAQLECDYELGADTLYSVKWYRDNEEFYRYLPKYDPPKHAYKLEGIKVDVSVLCLFGRKL